VWVVRLRIEMREKRAFLEERVDCHCLRDVLLRQRELALLQANNHAPGH